MAEGFPVKSLCPARMKQNRLYKIIVRWFLLVLVAASNQLLCSAAKARDGKTPVKRKPDSVLLVFNANSPISKDIANDYAEKRHVKNVLSIQCQDSAVATRSETI